MNVDQTFLPPRWQLWQFVGMTALFVIGTVAGVWVSLKNSDGSFAEPARAAMLCGGLGTLFTLLGVYLILTFHRSRLIVSPDALRLLTAFTDRTFRFDELQQAKWLPVYLGGSILLRSPTHRATLQFSWFVHGREIAPLLRDRVPLDRQEGFDRYDQFANRPRKVMKIDDRVVAACAVLAAVDAVLARLLHRGDWTAGLMMLAILCGPTVLVLAMIDMVRQFRWMRVFSAVVAAAAVAIAVVSLAQRIKGTW